MSFPGVGGMEFGSTVVYGHRGLPHIQRFLPVETLPLADLGEGGKRGGGGGRGKKGGVY